MELNLRHLRASDRLTLLLLKRMLPVVLMLLAATVDVFGQAPKKVDVIVLPFKINAAENLLYLQQEIPNAIQKHLAQEGANIITVPEAYRKLNKDLEFTDDEVRRIALANGADQAVWGSLTWFGDRFSLDVKLLEALSPEPPLAYSRDGRGLENLPVKVRELAGELVLIIFEQYRVTAIRIEGNQRIESDAILKMIKTQPGDIYSVKSLSADLKSVYSMGYFDDVRIEAEDDPEGKTIVFKVKEKPTIRYIRVKGSAPAYNEEEIKENLTLKTGSILNIFHIQNNIKRIEDLYREKNYHNVFVGYTLSEQPNNQVDVEFAIDEGSKVLIKEIRFIGNEAYSASTLKDQMKTSEKGFFSWLTQSGELNREDLNQDIAALEAFYHNNGYIRARVGEPEVDFKDDNIFITIKIDEGPRFRVGKVDIEGDLIFPKDVLLSKTQLKETEFYSQTVLRDDLLKLTDLYTDDGYAYANVVPRINEDAEKLIVNITYEIRKGSPVYFEEIIISGNTKTRDKVIRRQLKVYEQDLFSGSLLKQSVRNLQRLDYFQDVKVNTVRGSADDRMVLKIDVEEKSTGQFSFGGGYSTNEGFFVVGSVSQRNFLGRGQILDLRAELGGVNTRFSLSFTEPWLFDIPLSAGARIYRWITEFDAYTRDSRGLSLTVGYPIFENTRLSVSLNHDAAEIEVIEPLQLPTSIRQLVDEFGSGRIITNSVVPSLRYDTRDRIFAPTEGSDHRLAVEYAGLGGDIGFTKYDAQVSWYVPLVWKFVGYWRVKGGYVHENSGGVLPDYERYYLGGINSIRGYSDEEINPTDARGNEIGGDKFALTNVELIHPVAEDIGLYSYVFFDAGANVDTQAINPEKRNINSNTIRQSIGLGFRWNSPMGPIEIAYGYKLDRKPDESAGNWEFSVGAAF